MICNLISTFLVWISSIIAVFMIGAFIYFLKYDRIKGGKLIDIGFLLQISIVLLYITIILISKF